MRIVVFVSVSLILSACGGSEFVATPASEIPPGPGLFTGAEGEVVITPSGIR